MGFKTLTDPELPLGTKLYKFLAICPSCLIHILIILTCFYFTMTRGRSNAQSQDKQTPTINFTLRPYQNHDDAIGIKSAINWEEENRQIPLESPIKWILSECNRHERRKLASWTLFEVAFPKDLRYTVSLLISCKYEKLKVQGTIMANKIEQGLLYALVKHYDKWQGILPSLPLVHLSAENVKNINTKKTKIYQLRDEQLIGKLILMPNTK